MTSLFEPFDLAGLHLRNRIVMAPMTRSRAVTLAPDAEMVSYYRQRAGAGLIITEGTPISEEGRGHVFTPGIYTETQIDGWHAVTDAVHEAGGAIFAQLWHVGRQSHFSHQPDRGAPVSSSAKTANVITYAFDDKGEVATLPTSPPRALTTEEVRRVTRDFVKAAENAIKAGFDGIELHGANGYLFEQFINGAHNDRADHYGGSIENRLRFTLETIDAVAAAIGSHRTSIRIAPFGRFGDMTDFHDEEDTWLELARSLARRDLAYVHISEQKTIVESSGIQTVSLNFLGKFRKTYAGTLMLVGGFDRDSAQAAIDKGRGNLIAFGRPFIANPDLVARMRNGWPIIEPERATFYTRGPKGYTDYPEHNPGHATIRA